MTTGWNKNVKSALHHWWPQGVSRFWANQKGLVTRLSPDGITTEAPPKNFGAIRNAHQIVIRDSSNDGSVTYRESFEHLFNSVDRQFPTVIEWLKSLERRAVEFHLPFRKRFHVVSAPEDKLRYLIQGLFSLVVRSPFNRDACIAAAEFVRSHISKEELFREQHETSRYVGKTDRLLLPEQGVYLWRRLSSHNFILRIDAPYRRGFSSFNDEHRRTLCATHEFYR